MPRNYEARDYVEHTTAEVMEQFGNFANYQVISGCDLTYSGTDMTVTVSAGQVKHDGDNVAVDEDTVTLVADADDPRWTWIGIDSSGAAQISSGTAAEDPAIPAIGDYVPLALVKIEAGQTIASDIATRLDKRTFTVRPPEVSGDFLGTDVTTDSTVFTAIPELSAAVNANSTHTFRLIIWYTEVGAGYYKFLINYTGGTEVERDSLIYTTTRDDGSVGVHDSEGIGQGQGFGATTPGVILIEGAVRTGANPGRLQYYHARSSSGTSVTTKAKSWLEVF